MGIEPTEDDSHRPPPVLKTGPVTRSGRATVREASRFPSAPKAKTWTRVTSRPCARRTCAAYNPREERETSRKGAEHEPDLLASRDRRRRLWRPQAACPPRGVSRFRRAVDRRGAHGASRGSPVRLLARGQAGPIPELLASPRRRWGAHAPAEMEHGSIQSEVHGDRHRIAEGGAHRARQPRLAGRDGRLRGQ